MVKKIGIVGGDLRIVRLAEILAKEQNKNVEVYSCGIWAENGDIPTHEGIRVMEDYGIDVYKKCAKEIEICIEKIIEKI